MLLNRNLRLTLCPIGLVVIALPLCAFDQARVQALQRAAMLIEHHDLTAAEAALQPLLHQRADDALALNLLGLIRVQQQKPDQAEQLFHQAIESDTRIVGPHLNLARLYAAERPFDAIPELKEALKLKSDNPQAESLLHTIAKQCALNAARSGDKEKALAILLRAREVLPQDPELLYELGLVALESNLYQDAQKLLEQALLARPEYHDAIYALARAYLGQNMAKQAEEQMRKYLAAKTDDASAQYGLGYILMAEQKLGEAQAAFEKSLALQPNQTESLFQLGEIAIKQANNNAARESFVKVLSRDPHHAGALTELGILAYRASHYSEAKTTLGRAVASAPSYQKAHYYYALTLTKLGDKTNADHEFEISKSLQKSHITNPHLALTQP
ncbi:MAG: tetratricopeptide repeat protein [Bryobacteraceae bacterium]